MMTDAQLALARVELGTEMDEDDLQDRYDRTGDLTLAITEVLKQRLSDLVNTPASFNTPEYGQTTSENIKALTAQLDRITSAAVEVGGLSVVRTVRPRSTAYSR